MLCWDGIWLPIFFPILLFPAIFRRHLKLQQLKGMADGWSNRHSAALCARQHPVQAEGWSNGRAHCTGSNGRWGLPTCILQSAYECKKQWAGLKMWADHTDPESLHSRIVELIPTVRHFLFSSKPQALIQDHFLWKQKYYSSPHTQQPSTLAAIKTICNHHFHWATWWLRFTFLNSLHKEWIYAKSLHKENRKIHQLENFQTKMTSW